MCQSDQSFFEQYALTKVFQGVGSIGAIYISKKTEARDLDLLKEKGIQAVLCAQKDEQVNLPKKQIPQYLYLQIQDHPEFNITLFFEKSFKFIEENRRLTNLLVYCREGLNCSIALVIAYLIKKYQYTFQEAIQLIKRRYQQFSIKEFNLGFVQHLEYFAVQKGDFNLIKENHMRRKIQRVKRTFDGIVRSYSKELTTEQKLMGSPSPKKVRNKSHHGSVGSMTSIRSQSFLPYVSVQISKGNPQEQTQHSRQLSKEYSKFLPKKSEQEEQDEQHHKKIVSEIFKLNQQSRIYKSKRIESLNSDTSALKNYDRLKKCMQKHAFYSPLKKYDKYEMFTQNKLNLQFQAFNSEQL